MKTPIIVLLLLCSFLLETQAQAKWNCGVNGEANVIAVFDGTTQTLSISGKGKMGEGSPWKNLKEGIKIVKISQGVTTIGDNAFSDLSNLENVTIANTVTHIGAMAFWQTKGLRKIDIPNSIIFIGAGAFAHSGLEAISLPSSLKEMWESVFNNCTFLKTVDLSKTQLKRIDSKTFQKCEQLEDVNLPQKLEFIGEWAFASCKSLKSITSYNPTPPKLPYWPFGSKGRDDYVDISQLTLYVPEALVNIYKYSDVWKDFGKIETRPIR